MRRASTAIGAGIFTIAVMGLVGLGPSPGATAAMRGYRGAVGASRTTRVVMPTRDDYIGGIMDRNLFDEQAIERWRLDDEAPRGPVATLEVDLIGTVAASEPELSSAFLRRPGDTGTRVYRIGDQLDEHTLIRIAPREAAFRTPTGGEVRLRVGGTPAPVPLTTDSPSGSSDVSRLSGSEFEIGREVVEQFDLDVFARIGRIVPFTDDDGRLVGFTMSAFDDGSLPASLGFESGDVLMGVGDRTFRENPDVMAAFAEIRQREEFCVVVSRGGRDRELCYKVR